MGRVTGVKFNIELLLKVWKGSTSIFSKKWEKGFITFTPTISILNYNGSKVSKEDLQHPGLQKFHWCL